MSKLTAVFSNWPVRLLAGMLLFSVTQSGSAIIIRHDKGPDSYRISEVEFPAVFYLEQQNRRKLCVATLIHPRWAITAAHCLAETGLGAAVAQGNSYLVRVAGQQRPIDAVVVHPEYNAGSINEVDMALLRFSQELPFPQPLALQTTPVNVGDIVTLLGWGYFGLGTTGRQSSDGEFRRAQNRISRSDQRLEIIFNDPRILSEEVLELEGMPGLGDSGGPALLATSSGFALVGTAIGELMGDDFDEETQGKYGAVAVYENITRHIVWIEQVIDLE